MAHVIETAATGRAKCRGCAEKIGAGELRFGERLPNPFGEGEATLWFHPDCGALRRPEAFLEALETAAEPLPGRERLEAAARHGVAHPRLSRLDRAERAATGRAQCRSCRQSIAKDSWRIGLVFFEDGRFMPSGYVHAGCAPAYFETPEVMPYVRRFTPGLREEELRQIEQQLAVVPGPLEPAE